MRIDDQPRRPGAVPDEPAGPPVPLPAPIEVTDVTAGVDTDADGRADTVLAVDGDDLVLHTDLDADGFADQVLRLGPDGSVELSAAPPVGRTDPARAADPGGDLLGGLSGQASCPF